ncbi:DNA repair protein rhp57 like [Verticillium longisporum]|nr:DNA repair protein rhp57 like [Verticillium longisporum]
MTDLFRVLPHFPDGPFANLIPVLERHGVTTADLLSLDIADIGKRTQLPLLDISRLSNAVVAALHRDLGVSRVPAASPSPLKRTLEELTNRPLVISTLDDDLDRALGGGIPTGYVTEIAGESGVGKTQFLLSLMLAVQLPSPHGLGRRALYISTEAPLSTTRLRQILASNPLLSGLSEEERPTTDAIIVGSVADLESQEHILRFQVPVEVERSNIGLLVLDSVAANYRAEFERGVTKNHGSNMGARSNELIRLGALLRDLAQKYNLAVVVANQVGDRFSSPLVPRSSRMAPPRSSYLGRMTQESPLASRSKGRPPAAPEMLEPPSSMAEAFRSSMPEPPRFDDPGPLALPALELDHQQRWFTGWGDDPLADYGLKTPSLGLVWSTQIACRVALFKRAVYGMQEYAGDEEDGNLPSSTSWRRWMKVVFAPHVQAAGQGLDGAVEYTVAMRGLQAVKGKDAG